MDLKLCLNPRVEVYLIAKNSCTIKDKTVLDKVDKLVVDLWIKCRICHMYMVEKSESEPLKKIKRFTV